jgi:hypothetical protein
MLYGVLPIDAVCCVGVQMLEALRETFDWIDKILSIPTIEISIRSIRCCAPWLNRLSHFLLILFLITQFPKDDYDEKRRNRNAGKQLLFGLLLFILIPWFIIKWVLMCGTVCYNSFLILNSF